ncbi:Fur family transcriptional regulator [Sedimentibacter sp. MB31-C6]|uniref:Fur family transcriptional regulator n=1 Tax=Sedimentibacter sp. MB31-C6 TaxID=3109366 RepID=UPI002DDD6BB9|nr:Fur family transcriptional regulator [Sedimentibacter sp. MB36-C1]WSI03466.1 Fur family transcriptional regulator [Sedimentibacter sp. MB36-C1]
MKNNSYKLTGQRIAVLEVLAENSGEHLNADVILQIVLSKGHRIGMATVYRTLTLLKRLKFITIIYLNDGCIRYKLSDPNSKYEHYYLICECCGNVLDIEGDLLDSLEKQLFLKNRFRVSNHRVKHFGICEKCMDEQY